MKIEMTLVVGTIAVFLPTLALAQENTAYGSQALSSVTTGKSNSAFGHRALRYTTSGSENTAVERGASTRGTTARANTAVGQDALYWNTTGEVNVAIGYGAGQGILGSANVAVGSWTLKGSGTSADTGSENTVRREGAKERHDKAARTTRYASF